MAIIKQCSCVSEYQDRRYGLGYRVKNETKDEGLRCTVCGTKEGGRGGK